MRYSPLALLSLALALITAPLAAAEGPPPTGPDAAPWQSAFPHPAPSAEPIVKTSDYVTMRDGTRIAVDTYRPRSAGPDARIPTLIMITRYWRAAAMKSDPVASCKAVPGAAGFFASHGYAMVIVDARGTGASFGKRSGELDDNELADGPQLIDWIVRQPWSNGKVGSTGISYAGTAAEYLLLHRHPAMKAIAPISTLIDAYADLYFPGGVPNHVFRDGWGELNSTLDAGQGPKLPAMADYLHPCPVDGDEKLALLGAAIAEHKGNFDSGAATRGLLHRDGNDVFTVRLPSSYQRRKAIDDPDVPFLSIEGWFDSGYARAGLDRLLSSKSRNQRLIIAPASHGLGYYSAPGVTQPTAPAFDLFTEVLSFFDHYLGDKPNGYDKQPRVKWFTSGINTWESAEDWTEPARPAAFCIASRRSLAPAGLCGHSPAITHRPGADGNPGPATRWNATISGGPVIYPERSAFDADLLTFDSAVLEKDLKLTGTPQLILAIKTTAPRADVFAYLEELDANGKAWLITDGMVRANYKGAPFAAYKSVSRQPSGLARDDQATIAGKPLRLTIAFEPLSHVVTKGKRLRLTLAASDRDHFKSPSAAGSKWTIIGGNAGTKLLLPAVP